MRRLVLLCVPAACLLLAALALYAGREQLSRLPKPSFLVPHKDPAASYDSSPPAAAASTSVSGPTLRVKVRVVSLLPQATTLTAFVDAIMNSEAKNLSRLHCPKLDEPRYRHLLPGKDDGAASKIRYFFALDLRHCLPLLPQLIGSVVEAIRFLGPEHCALSVVEGNSDDGTDEVLAALRPALEDLGTAYHFQSGDIDPQKGDHIKKPAQLRNMALEPLLHDDNDADSDDTTVVFLNHVAICAEKIKAAKGYTSRSLIMVVTAC